VVGGGFFSAGGSLSNSHLARLLSDGTLDTTFSTGPDGISSTVWCLAVDSDGRVVIGGDLSNDQQYIRPHIARLNVDGSVDGSFLPTNTIDGSVLALAIQTNHSVIIGGSFYSQGTVPGYLARLNADGTTDTTFDGYLSGAVYAIAIQTDGKIVIGGNFQTVGGASRRNLARLSRMARWTTPFKLVCKASLPQCVACKSRRMARFSLAVISPRSTIRIAVMWRV